MFIENSTKGEYVVSLFSMERCNAMSFRYPFSFVVKQQTRKKIHTSIEVEDGKVKFSSAVMPYRWKVSNTKYLVLAPTGVECMLWIIWSRQLLHHVIIITSMYQYFTVARRNYRKFWGHRKDAILRIKLEKTCSMEMERKYHRRSSTNINTKRIFIILRMNCVTNFSDICERNIECVCIWFFFVGTWRSSIGRSKV